MFINVLLKNILNEITFLKDHERKIQKLAIKMFKENNGFSEKLTGENFHFAENVM